MTPARDLAKALHSSPFQIELIAIVFTHFILITHDRKFSVNKSSIFISFLS